MQYIDFPAFLTTRYRCCIHASFSVDVLRQYPSAAQILYQTWYDLEAKNTCPYKYRLEYDDPVLEPSYVQSQVRYLSDTIPDPTKQCEKPISPWFKYWVELPFNTDKAPSYLFIDVPVCYIFVSTEPCLYKPPTPPWMEPYVKDVPVFNLVISQECESKQNTFVVKEASVKAFFDFVLKITHYEAAPRLTALREITEQYIKDNWGGFKNSVFRLLGFGSRVNRNEIILKLKQLGDVCFGCGDFNSAFNYYQQLYQELQDTDPPVSDSLFIMFAISSILTNSDIDVAALLDPILREKRSTILTQIQSCLLSAYYSIFNCKPTKTIKYYQITYNLIRNSNLGFTFISYPMIAEALSTVDSPKKSSLWLYNASEYYKHLGLQRLVIIFLWRIYHQIRFTGWPHLEQLILLQISTFGEVPPQLQNFLIQRNIPYVKDTIAQLNKLKAKKLIFGESIIIHELIIPPTGFPQSPPPKELEITPWSTIRKKLFPVIFHPSTEEFAATVWNDDPKLVNDYEAGFLKEHHIEFKMTPGTAESECQLVNLQLYVEPEDSVELENYECIALKQKETKRMVMKFTPKKLGKFQIKGIKFLWFGVSPVAILFHDSIRFDTVEHYPNASLEIVTVPEISYLDLPIFFNAKIKLLKRINNNDSSSNSSLNESSELSDSFEDCDTINSLDIVADSAQAFIQLQEPPSPGFQQRWSLDPSKSEQELTFEVTPTSSGIVTVNLFISYTNICHVTRFSHASLSFECKEVHNLRISQHENIIDIQPNNDIDTIDCDCAKIEKDENGSVRIIEPNYDFSGDRCSIAVQRNFTGTVMNNILHINDIFLKFEKTKFDFVKPNQEIKLVFDAICLGKFDGVISLVYNDNPSFLFNGKIKYNLKGPAVRKISLSLIILKPCEIDLGDLMKVEYGKMPIKVSTIVRIE